MNGPAELLEQQDGIISRRQALACGPRGPRDRPTGPPTGMDTGPSRCVRPPHGAAHLAPARVGRRPRVRTVSAGRELSPHVGPGRRGVDGLPIEVVVPHRRAWLRDVLEDVALGTCSLLEHGYLTRVERPHGLPRCLRQVADDGGNGRRVFRDGVAPGPAAPGPRLARAAAPLSRVPTGRHRRSGEARVKQLHRDFPVPGRRQPRPRISVDLSRISTLRILPVTVIGNSSTSRT